MGRDGLPPRGGQGQPGWDAGAHDAAFAALVLAMATFVPLGSPTWHIGTLFAFLLVSVAVPVLRRLPDLPRPSGALLPCRPALRPSPAST